MEHRDHPSTGDIKSAAEILKAIEDLHPQERRKLCEMFIDGESTGMLIRQALDDRSHLLYLDLRDQAAAARAKRVAYGTEDYWLDTDFEPYCNGCGVAIGQLHVAGCSFEQCAACEWPAHVVGCVPGEVCRCEVRRR
jgi:hypothetical protein